MGVAKITGNGRVSRRLNGLAGKEKVELVGRALFVGGDMVRAEASRLITEGAVSGKNHIPSLPGNPPLNDSGHLRSNIHVEQPAPLRVLVVADAEYAAALEYGTSKMAERPFMRPATEHKRKDVVGLVHRAVNAATRKRK